MNRVPFDPEATNYNRAQDRGHRMRTGHALTGYYVVDGGTWALVRTCGCSNEDAAPEPNPTTHAPHPSGGFYETQR
jgi:hypothetical protein